MNSTFALTILDELLISDVVEKWALYRDAGDWERFRRVWHEDGYMSATWFQGPAEEFVEASRRGMAQGVSILHFLGGTAVEAVGDRAVAQTKMTISQRDTVHGVLVDVLCTGRFYDFFAKREGQWRIVRRQPIYEKDRMDPVRPGTVPDLDEAVLASFPEGYRHLGYLQTAAGFEVRDGLPGLRGEAVERLYREGRDWLAGSRLPGAVPRIAD
ncbi:nuclear transport factor 2 family protein [Kutzneria viridogrisea]|uniref:SnoaL-like domain-containing protein n=2 Tax=Kutzneria TaxID=43356 RepID=W5W1S1_9PSEU|nr:nuclear transport factor 2 family protein [Kutzneria albida]AHH94501.1 hypothetical protein KALB_1128 [Kutzneria albida DSM 43870]MBA8930168.1 hypothetical protein [Kutzneria viridogrisea]